MYPASELPHTVHSDLTVPFDRGYTNFLQALSEIHDETIRNRCHTHWISLHRYLERSITNEQALKLEEKRTCEILHRLELETTTCRSEVVYRVHNVLQQAHQVLEDLYAKYNNKRLSLKEIEGNIDELGNRIQARRSEGSISAISSSITLHSIRDTIDNLKLELNALQITRETSQIKLHAEKNNFFAMQTHIYRIQLDIHKTKRELIEIVHQLDLNHKVIHERDGELECLRRDHHSAIALYDQEYSSIDQKIIQKQLSNKRKLFLELKKQNKELNNSLLHLVDSLKMTDNKQKELVIENKDLIDVVRIRYEEIGKEKEIKQQVFQRIIELRKDLKRKQHSLLTHHRQLEKFKTQMVELERQRDICLQHTALESMHQSTADLKKDIHREIDHRLKLTITHNNLKYDINALTDATHQYISVVKEQREKLIHYEKLHDKWILHINKNRKRLLDLFNRVDTIEQSIVSTRKVFDQLNLIQLSFKPNVLEFYHEINIFLQRRREKDNDIAMAASDESKSSLNMKLHQTVKLLVSNQTMSQQLERDVSLLHQNHSLLLHQISTIHQQQLQSKQRFDFLHHRWLIKQQQLSNISDALNHLKHQRDLNCKRGQGLTEEKQKVVFFVLKRQHLIVLINKRLQFNERILNKRRSCHEKLLAEIRHTRIVVLRQLQLVKPVHKQSRANMTQFLLRLRKELFQCKRKSNSFQDVINRRHRTRQILAQADEKLLITESTEQYRAYLKEKASWIIYRLICKTHCNIILYKRLDVVMRNIALLYHSDHVPPQRSDSICFKHSSDSNHLDNQLKAYVAELRVLKNELFIHDQVYIHIKHSLADDFLVS